MSAVVVEDLGVFDAILHAKEVLKKKFWVLLLMGFILIFVQMTFNMIVMVPMQILQFFFIFSMDMTSPTPPDMSNFFTYFAIISVIFVPLSSLAQSLGLTYANAAWMLSYLDITAPSEVKIKKE